jgi:hypothetical protein
MRFEMTRPLDIIWESGLTLVEPVDMRWPTRRFGIFSDEESKGLPADVFGMTLVKEDRQVEIEFRKTDAPVKSVPAYRVPTLIPQPAPDERPLWRRAGGRLARELRKGASK